MIPHFLSLIIFIGMNVRMHVYFIYYGLNNWNNCRRIIGTQYSHTYYTKLENFPFCQISGISGTSRSPTPMGEHLWVTET